MTQLPPDTAARRLRRAVRLYRARTQGLIGVAQLLVLALLGRVDEVWIGDSHAVHVNSATMVTALKRLPDGRWIWHLGPRIMYSIAREGLPPAALRVLGMIRHTRRASEIVWVFSFGEIDVRCHLVPRMDDPENALAFVPLYLERVHGAATLAGARRALVLVPLPQSDTYPEQTGFPVVGGLGERVKANLQLRESMVRAVDALTPGGASVTLIDVTDALADQRGAILEDLTSDGLHTNEAGRAIVRAEVEQILRDTAGGRA